MIDSTHTGGRTASTAAPGAIIGGTLWALTPLRQPIFGAGRTADEGEMFFRGYNLVVVVIAALLTVALLRLRRSASPASRLHSLGWWTVLVGHALIAAGSLPAVILGGSAESFVMGGQDVGFIGAMLAALGALALGSAALRDGSIPRAAAVLFVATLPLGVLGMTLAAVIGVPEDYLGLPLTLLYGGAWVVLGAHRAGARVR